MKTPMKAPEYVLYRIVAAGDTGTITDKNSGINMGGYRRASVQVVPDAAQTLAVQVLFWSEAAAAFIVQDPPISFTGKTAAFEFNFEVETSPIHAASHQAMESKCVVRAR